LPQKCAALKKARKTKEFMRSIIDNLKKCEAYNKGSKKLSEIDTQVLLVDPILCLAGYDISNPKVVKRADRGSKKEQFDVEVYSSNEDLMIAIEVKALKSNEFNISDQFQIQDRAGNSGNLAICCKNFEKSGEKKKRTQIYNGNAWDCGLCKSTAQCANDELYFCNYHSDGVGQLRAYCINYLNKTLFRKEQLTVKISEIKFKPVRFIPILTNGRKWVIFKKNFVRAPFEKIIIQDHAEAYADLEDTDFFQKIIKKLRKT